MVPEASQAQSCYIALKRLVEKFMAKLVMYTVEKQRYIGTWLTTMDYFSFEWLGMVLIHCKQ